MTEAKLAPNLPQWMKDHTDRYLKSGGTDGHMYTINLPNLPSREVPSLLLTTTGRKSGDQSLFPLFYGQAGDILANPNVEVQVGTKKLKAKARTAIGAERAKLWAQSLTFWPPYADYQVKAGSREIPVVVLDPVK